MPCESWHLAVLVMDTTLLLPRLLLPTNKNSTHTHQVVEVLLLVSVTVNIR